jgi:phenylpropionate dioxygenase-like ring-hydroxylating dioxygenase large terminal subunit
MEDSQSASQESTASAWPRYDAAVNGFRNYWYPVLFSRDVGRKPRAITLAGEKIVLVRDKGRLRALHDRCPHRGVPLSAGRSEFPGFITCAYHGWTYDLQSGELAAVLTDGPDSPICGKAVVQVKTYPVEERAGLVWVYVGEEPPPPVEMDIPEELLAPNAVIEGLTEVRNGNWRYAAENAIDEGHAKYLHRTAVWAWLRQVPAWTKGVRMAPSDDDAWLLRLRGETVMQDVYPRVGRWPGPKRFWQRARRGATGLAARLPCIFRVQQRGWVDWEIFVPVDESHHLAMFLAVRLTHGIDALIWKLRYQAFLRWVYYGLQNRVQDQWMVELMNIPPERLYRPDVSITAWRKWCHERARPALRPSIVDRLAAEPAQDRDPVSAVLSD